jgi:phosphate/phosphite/phosphonate ABC transporter binding protein
MSRSQSSAIDLRSTRAVSRRRFCAAALAATLPVATRAADAPIHIGTTAVILDDQVGFMRAWRDYLQPRLGRPVVFMQRGSYREITAMLLGDQLDFAWVCGYPYVRHRDALELLALPNYGGKPLYRSYLIVPATDESTAGFAALGGKVLAYSDPDSNSGFLVPQYEMLRIGVNPTTHFRKTFFTYAHRKVVQAVADGVAEGGTVDGYVWETLALRTPTLTKRTRVAHVSDEYGFPPIVARRSLDQATCTRFRDALLAMPDDANGRALLHELNLEGFLPPDDEPFRRIDRILAFVASRERLPT